MVRPGPTVRPGEGRRWAFSHRKRLFALVSRSPTRLCISTLGWMPRLVTHAEQMFVVFGEAAAEKAKKNQAASRMCESVSHIRRWEETRPRLRWTVLSCRLYNITAAAWRHIVMILFSIQEGFFWWVSADKAVLMYPRADLETIFFILTVNSRAILYYDLCCVTYVL